MIYHVNIAHKLEKGVVFLCAIASYICTVILKKRNVMKVVKNLTVAAALLTRAIAVANTTATEFGKKTVAKYEVEKNLVKVNLDPVFVRKGQKVMMNLLNVSKGKVLLKVYDSEERLVFDEAIDGDIVVEKAFNFEKAFRGEYTIVVVDKFGTYKQKMVVR